MPTTIDEVKFSYQRFIGTLLAGSNSTGITHHRLAERLRKVDAGHNRTGSTVRAKPLKSPDTDGADASDAENLPSSIPEKNRQFT